MCCILRQSIIRANNSVHHVRGKERHKQFATHREFPRAVPCGWWSASSLFSTISGRMPAINLLPDLPSRRPYLCTNVYISGSIAARNSPGTRNSLLMSWRFLRPFHRAILPLRQGRSQFWHDIQLAPGERGGGEGCNHLAGLPCVTKNLGRGHAFVSRKSTCARARILVDETFNRLVAARLFGRENRISRGRACLRFLEIGRDKNLQPP